MIDFLAIELSGLCDLTDTNIALGEMVFDFSIFCLPVC